MRLIRDREKGRGGGEGAWRWEKKEIMYLSLHCHHQNDFCIKVGSDESQFNVSVGNDGQSHKTVSTNHNLSGGPSTYQPNAFTTKPTRLTSLCLLPLRLDISVVVDWALKKSYLSISFLFPVRHYHRLMYYVHVDQYFL